MFACLSAGSYLLAFDATVKSAIVAAIGTTHFRSVGSAIHAADFDPIVAAV
jgi:hypothetical protein